MGLASSLKAYFFGFMPVQLIVAMVEGAMYGGWRLSAPDLMDQLSGWLVFAAPWLGLSALFVVPLFVIAFRFVNSKVDVKRQRLSALILGPLSVAGGSTITSLLLGGLGILGWIWVIPFILVLYPFAWLIAGTAFGYLSIRREGTL